MHTENLMFDELKMVFNVFQKSMLGKDNKSQIQGSCSEVKIINARIVNK